MSCSISSLQDHSGSASDKRAARPAVQYGGNKNDDRPSAGKWGKVIAAPI
jgi:hypothetical protein